MLQSGHQLGRPLRVKDINELAGVVPTEIIEESIKAATELNAKDLATWVEKKLVIAAYPALQFVHQVNIIFCHIIDIYYAACGTFGQAGYIVGIKKVNDGYQIGRSRCFPDRGR